MTDLETLKIILSKYTFLRWVKGLTQYGMCYYVSFLSYQYDDKIRLTNFLYYHSNVSDRWGYWWSKGKYYPRRRCLKRAIKELVDNHVENISDLKK